jgi:hypothetical protein
MKNSSDTIGNRTRDLPVCSAVPQQTAPPRAPDFHVKVKVPLTGPKAQRGGRGIALLFPDHGARRRWMVSTTPRPLYLWERLGTHCTGGWVGPRAGLDVCEKSRPPPGFDPRTVQPVASRYTD